MRIAVAGAQGRVARAVVRLLAARGDAVRGLIAVPAGAADVLADGAEPSLCDPRTAALPELAMAVEGCDTVVVVWGDEDGDAGPGGAPGDADASAGQLVAAAAAGVPGFVLVRLDGVVALDAAERRVRDSDRQSTVVRGAMSDAAAGRGRVHVGADAALGPVDVEDLAAVVVAAIHDARAVGRILTVGPGDADVDAALDAALGADPRDQRAG
jgi:nucleoside-diphosphate-sugar epimerase